MFAFAIGVVAGVFVGWIAHRRVSQGRFFGPVPGKDKPADVPAAASQK